jgi:hypothetical protein
VRIIKLGLISLFFLFVLVTLISLLIPGRVRISKAINLPGGSETRVWALVRDTARWNTWLPMLRPGVNNRHIEPIRVVGQERTDSTTVMHWQQGNRDPLTTVFQLHHPDADSLTLQWYMDFHLGWAPWKKFGSLFLENTYGTMMQEGLENMKAEIERQPGQTELPLK